MKTWEKYESIKFERKWYFRRIFHAFRRELGFEKFGFHRCFHTVQFVFFGNRIILNITFQACRETKTHNKYVSHSADFFIFIKVLHWHLILYCSECLWSFFDASLLFLSGKINNFPNKRQMQCVLKKSSQQGGSFYFQETHRRTHCIRSGWNNNFYAFDRSVQQKPEKERKQLRKFFSCLSDINICVRKFVYKDS